METIYTELTVHNGEKRIKLEYEYIKGNILDKKVRSFSGCRWSKTMKCWHIPYRQDYVNFFIIVR